MKYSIMIIHPSASTYGGPDQCLFGLIQKTDQNRFETYLTIPKDTPNAPKYDRYVKNILTDVNAGPYHQLRYLRSNLTLFLHNFISFKNIRVCLRRRNVHLVYTNGENSWAYGLAARSLNIPSVVHIHGLTTLKSAFGAIWMPAVLKTSADHLIAVSKPVAEAFIRAGVAAERISVVDNGVDVTRFQPGSKKPSTNNRDGCFVIGAVGSADPRKGWLTLVDACAHLRTKYPRLRCMFVGDLRTGQGATWGGRTYQEELQSRVEALGLQETITFTGVRMDMPEVYASFDLLVQPSLIEAGPRAVIEAMACGVPVVATRVGGNSDYLEDGVTGLLCPPGDPARMAETIDQLLVDEERRCKMSEQGRRTALERFSLEAYAQKVQNIYLRLLNPDQIE